MEQWLNTARYYIALITAKYNLNKFLQVVFKFLDF